jgi:hypothetical protein
MVCVIVIWVVIKPRKLQQLMQVKIKNDFFVYYMFIFENFNFYGKIYVKKIDDIIYIKIYNLTNLDFL